MRSPSLASSEQNVMNDQPPDASSTSGALAVWLKLAALLAGLSAFGFLVFWVTRLGHGGG